MLVKKIGNTRADNGYLREGLHVGLTLSVPMHRLTRAGSELTTGIEFTPAAFAASCRRISLTSGNERVADR